MRLYVLLATTCLVAACGGAGGSLHSVGSSAGSTGGTGTATPTPTASATATPVATPTPGATPTATPTSPSSTATNPAATPTGANLLDVKVATDFKAVGGTQSLTRTTTATGTSVLYSGNAATPAAATGTISYDPRDGIFTMTLADTKAGVTRNVRFQDPAHRTDFANALRPDPSVIDLTNYNYMASQDGTGATTFFYQRPGNRTNYVTLGAFVHNTSDAAATTQLQERGVFAFGAPTAALQLPRTGTGRFEGDFLASMIVNTAADTGIGASSRFQWINGTSIAEVDFAKSALSLALSGTASQAWFQGQRIADTQLSIPSGSAFAAAGAATIDFNAGTFAGRFTSAGFTVNGVAVPIAFAPVSTGSNVAGASSIDGTFYGPDAVEVGGSFRITGGVPDQRVDILGGFTGARK